MGNNKEDYFEYIDIITGTIRRKRTGLFPRDNENIFIADNNITIPKSVKDKLGDKIQNALPINSEKFHYSTKTSLQSPSEHNIQAPEYSQNTEKLQLSPADSLAPITFLDSKAKLTEGKQLIAKNKDSIAEDETIITVEPPEMVIMTKRHIDQKPQILESASDLGEENERQAAKIETQIPVEVGKEIREGEGENLVQEQLTQRLAKEEEKERQLLDAEDLGGLEEQRVGVGNLDLEVAEERHVQELEPPLEEEERQRLELEQRLARKEEEARLERERIAREEEEERVKQQKLKEYYDKYNADVLARVERQKREEERQKQLQKFKEYQEQQVREVLIQLEYKKQLEKQRLTEVLDKLKEGVVSLELANKQATKLLPGGFFFKEHLLVREAKKQLGLQKVALENGVIPGLEKLEELEELVIGITRTAEVITQETQRLRQVEAVKARIKVEHTIKKPLEVAEKKSWLEQIKYKLSCCFSANDHEPKPKMIEMVSMHTNVQDEEISVDSIGEQVTVNSSVEIV
ncbi:MAG: hypothetical protein EBQ62_03090 [Alphaproteobacteria bacterium]|nr:hypothetical protein [Alphaproteobacteria bacterium]